MSWLWEEEKEVKVDKVLKRRLSSGGGLTEGLLASCDEQVKWGENNTLVIKDNLRHYNFSNGQKISKLYLKENEKVNPANWFKDRSRKCVVGFARHVPGNYLKNSSPCNASPYNLFLKWKLVCAHNYMHPGIKSKLCFLKHQVPLIEITFENICIKFEFISSEFMNHEQFARLCSLHTCLIPECSLNREKDAN